MVICPISIDRKRGDTKDEMMMQIRQGQELEYKNILSLRKKMPQTEISAQMMTIGKYLDSARAKPAGPVITTTFAVEMVEGKQVVDFEILAPIDKALEETEGFRIKPRFHLVNAVCARHEGDPARLQGTYNELMKFLGEENLQPITSFYNVSVNEGVVTDVNNVAIDIYVGVNPSVV